MIYSMTGFGLGRALKNGNRVECTIKSVNHRFCEVGVYLPKQFISMDTQIRKTIQSKLARGRIDCHFTVDAAAAKAYKVRINEDLANNYVNALAKLQKKTKTPGEISIAYLASQPGVVETTENESAKAMIQELMLQALDKALTRHLAMRKSEGAELKKDISARCRTIGKCVTALKKAVPKVQKSLKENVVSRMSQITGDVEVDPERVEKEVAYLLMKMDVSEELMRLGAHVQQLTKILREGGRIGRKMEFLLQEAHREINTCGSKVQGMEISSLVVEIKAELEKIREQIQNVE